MATKNLKTASTLSVIVALLAAIASLGGLALPRLYRDNLWATAQFQGNDIVTLLVAVPLLIIGVSLAGRGSQRGALLWLGMSHYMLYNYAFYLFGAAFNLFFLLYTALFCLSILSLIALATGLDISALAQNFDPQTPVRWIAGFLIILAVCLGGLWIAMSLAFVFSGQVPQVVIDSGHPTSVIFAVDLSLLVPAALLGGIWSWQRKPWGYVLAAAVGFSGSVYTLALAAMGVTANMAGIPGALSLLPVWLLLSAACAACGVILLVNLKPASV